MTLTAAQKTRSRNWTSEEDQEVLAAVQKHGLTDWNDVATELAEQVNSTKSAKQCRERWFTRLNPAIDHSPWTEADEERLTGLVDKHGRVWAMIAQFFPGRPPSQLKNKFYARARRINRRIQRENPGAPPIIIGRSGRGAPPTPSALSSRRSSSSSSTSSRSCERSLPPTPAATSSATPSEPRSRSHSLTDATSSTSASSVITTAEVLPSQAAFPSLLPLGMPFQTLAASLPFTPAMLHSHSEPQSGNSRRGSIASLPTPIGCLNGARRRGARQLALERLAALAANSSSRSKLPVAAAGVMPLPTPATTASSGDTSTSAVSNAVKGSKSPVPVKHESEESRSTTPSLFPMPVSLPSAAGMHPQLFPLNYFPTTKSVQHTPTPLHPPLPASAVPLPTMAAGVQLPCPLPLPLSFAIHSEANTKSHTPTPEVTPAARPTPIAGSSASSANGGGARRNAPRRKRARSPPCDADAGINCQSPPPRILSPCVASPAPKRARVDPITKSQLDSSKTRNSRTSSPSLSFRDTTPKATPTKCTRDVGCQTELWYAPTVVVREQPSPSADTDADDTAGVDAHRRCSPSPRRHDTPTMTSASMHDDDDQPTSAPSHMHYAAMMAAFQRFLRSCPPQGSVPATTDVASPSVAARHRRSTDATVSRSASPSIKKRHSDDAELNASPRQMKQRKVSVCDASPSPPLTSRVTICSPSPLASPAMARRITPPSSPPPPTLASVSPPPPMKTALRGLSSPIPIMANIRPPPTPAC